MKPNRIQLIQQLLVVVLISCNQPNEVPYELPKNAQALVAGKDSKTWKIARRFNNETRMNMGDCFLSHRETFHRNLTMQNNSGEQANCGETLQANWKFIKDKKGNFYLHLSSDQLPKLMNIKDDFKLFKILRLEENQMTLQFQHKQFSNKTTTITDIFVPENLSVKDRDFHW